MKVILFAVISLLISITYGYSQEWQNLKRYSKENQELISTKRVKGRVVFMGNSITDNWYKFHPEFFKENGFIGRGISGQTTPQMLLRFRQDVVNIGAETVVILAGTNDIAGNTGYSTLEMIMDNIAGMCEIAKANKIKVILCSVLPAYRYSWKKEVRPDLIIPQLNKKLQKYAKENGIKYIDFFSPLVDTSKGNENGLPAKYSKDGVHPNLAGYAVMEKILLEAL